MDWPLFRHALVRYTLLYAAATVAGVYLVTRSALALLVVVLVGLLALLFALGGTGSIGMGTAVANAQAGGLRSGIVDPADLVGGPIDADLKALFYGVGLILFGMGALVAAG